LLEMLAGASITVLFGSNCLVSNSGILAIFTDICLRVDPY